MYTIICYLQKKAIISLQFLKRILTFALDTDRGSLLYLKKMTENLIGERRRPGRIEVVCGSMFSGKTEELIRRMRRAQFAKQKVEIFKPAIDTRYSEEEVVSHDQHAIRLLPEVSHVWSRFTPPSTTSKAPVDREQEASQTLLVLWQAQT